MLQYDTVEHHFQYTDPMDGALAPYAGKPVLLNVGCMQCWARAYLFTVTKAIQPIIG